MAKRISLIDDLVTPDLMWNEFPANPYQEETINDGIKDDIGESEIPVTSIPSPFAQMHLYDTAFSFINESYKDGGRAALEKGSTYHRLVSNCLDMYELLFNHDTLGLSNRISVVTWKFDVLEELLKDHNEGVKAFARSLKVFIHNYNQDKRFTNQGVVDAFSSISLIYCDHIIIGSTSPYTGFCPIGDYSTIPVVKDLRSKPFFQSISALYTRDPEFQKFLNLYFESDPLVSGVFKSMFQYLKNNRKEVEDSEMKDFYTQIGAGNVENNKAMLNVYKILDFNNYPLPLVGSKAQFRYKIEIKKDTDEMISNSHYAIRSSKSLEKPPLALIDGTQKAHWTYIQGPLPEGIDLSTLRGVDYKHRKLPGSDIEYVCFTRDDVLSKHLVKLEYEINDARFWTLEHGTANDILLPIKADYFKFFTIEDLKRNLSIDKLSGGAIVVKLKIPTKGDDGDGHLTYERTYIDVDDPKNVDDDDKGAIVTSGLGFGIYPFFKVSDGQFNDYYNILQYFGKDEDITCQFHKENDGTIDASTVSASYNVDRTRKAEGQSYITRYTELSSFYWEGDEWKNDNADMAFDFIEVKVITNDGVETDACIIPNMETIQIQNSASTIAFDIGTSNSFMAYANEEGGKPEDFSSFKDSGDDGKGLHLVFLHKKNSEDFRGSEAFDFNSKTGEGYTVVQANEHLPSLIGNKFRFGLPVRTIINQDNDTDPTSLKSVKVLSNINIPFAFGIQSLREEFDFAFSNLKWEIANPTDKGSEHRLHLFIEQFALMGRNKLLSEGKNPALTNVIWFKPLSMSVTQQQKFGEIWDKVYRKYYNKDLQAKSILTSVTESWAPFYSHERAFGAGEFYMNIDIGGGTTDILIFRNEKPEVTSSFRFAGDSLFDSGNSRSDAGDNGFVVKYHKLMTDFFEGDDPDKKIKREVLKYIRKSQKLSSADIIGFLFTIPEFIKQLKADSDFQLLFLIHNAAIFYHAAQILKMSKVGMPKYIGLSGNGARLLEITNRNKDLNRNKGLSMFVEKIFEFVLGEGVDKIELEMDKEPKNATAYGGIKGLKEINHDPNADVENYFIPLGDAETGFKDVDTKMKKEFKYADFLEGGNEKKALVADNVLAFFEYFFDTLWYDMDLVKNFGLSKELSPDKLKSYFCDKENILATLHDEINFKKTVERENNLVETMFFYPIKAYLYDCSKILADESQLKNYKN